MTESNTLKTALKQGGAYVVWDLMDEPERMEAAAALWRDADPQSRAALEVALAKEMKFRQASIRRLPAQRIATRLARMADNLPDTVLFQFLFHLHMAERRELMIEFLDEVGLPHNEGVLEVEDDTAPPDPDTVTPAAAKLHEKHGHQGLLYLSTLMVADPIFWEALGDYLETLDASGTPTN